MGNNNVLLIEIEYCKKNGKKKLIKIPSLEYFEEPDEDEKIEYDSTPKYIEQYEYTKEKLENLDWSILKIYDKSKSIKMICEEKYWGHNNSHRMSVVSLICNDTVERLDKTIEITDTKAEKTHILKLTESSSDKICGLVSHTIIDGSGENEKVIIELGSS
jgi:hypothetical protein